MWPEFAQEFTPRENRTWARRDYLGNVPWFEAPAPPGTPVSLHHWNGQPLVLAPDGHAIGLAAAPAQPKSARSSASEHLPEHRKTRP